MLNKLWTYLQYGNRFCGIEHTSKNGKNSIIVSILKQSKKELHIASSFEEKAIEGVSKKLQKNQHVVLVINNDKVLSKQVESEQKDALKLVYKAFPNINIDDFYFEVLSEKNNHFISLCRKDYVNSIINEYSKNEISIIDVLLGNTLISTITEFINENLVYSSNTKISIKDKQITQIEKKEVIDEDYDINGLKVSNNQLLSFSGALQSILKNKVTKSNFEARKELLLNDFRQTRFFNLFLKTGGFFILGLLLVNFFFFNHYFNKVNELKQVSEINLSTKTQIIKLNEVVSKKQKMVDDLLKSNGSKSSFYSNTIIHSLPKTILLSEFNYQPLLKRIKADKDIELEQNRISLSGVSNNSERFSGWISQLEQENWINKVNIIDYRTKSSSSSNFKIKIILNDE